MNDNNDFRAIKDSTLEPAPADDKRPVNRPSDPAPDGASKWSIKKFFDELSGPTPAYRSGGPVSGPGWRESERNKTRVQHAPGKLDGKFITGGRR
jgi:hypothetical protein